MNFIKVEAVERIILTLPHPFVMLPTNIIRDVEHFLGVKNCVIHFVAYLGNKYCLTICSTQACEKLVKRDKMLIERFPCHYQVVEKRLNRIKILQPPVQMRSNHIDGVIRHYGRILYSEIENRRGQLPFYFALIDLNKPFPEKISIRHKLCDVVCY